MAENDVYLVETGKRFVLIKGQLGDSLGGGENGSSMSKKKNYDVKYNEIRGKICSCIFTEGNVS